MKILKTIFNFNKQKFKFISHYTKVIQYFISQNQRQKSCNYFTNRFYCDEMFFMSLIPPPWDCCKLKAFSVCLINLKLRSMWCSNKYQQQRQTIPNSPRLNRNDKSSHPLSPYYSISQWWRYWQRRSKKNINLFLLLPLSLHSWEDPVFCCSRAP